MLLIKFFLIFVVPFLRLLFLTIEPVFLSISHKAFGGFMLKSTLPLSITSSSLLQRTHAGLAGWEFDLQEHRTTSVLLSLIVLGSIVFVVFASLAVRALWISYREEQQRVRDLKRKWVTGLSNA